MTRLQGNWILSEAIDTGTPEVRFFLWGEVWRRSSIEDEEKARSIRVLAHPYGMNSRDLAVWLTQLNPSLTATPDRCEVALPTCDRLPIISDQPIPDHRTVEGEVCAGEIYLQPWQVEGVSFSVTDTYRWLSGLPLHASDESSDKQAWMSQSVMFWVHVVRWAMSLLVRGKYLPEITIQGDRAQAQWQALLDSTTDQNHLQHFVQHFPSSGRFYSNASDRSPQIDLTTHPETLVRTVVNHLIDSIVRSQLSTNPKEMALRDALTGKSALTQRRIAAPLGPIAHWLFEPLATLPKSQVQTLQTQLKSWYAPLQSNPANFRVALKLEPPQYGSREWHIEYGMQVIGRPDRWLGAQVIWNHSVRQLEFAGRMLRDPQETLLSGLGTASKVFPALESSLKTSKPTQGRIDPTQAYELIRYTGLQLQEHGIGVILPEGLANRAGGTAKFGIKLAADMPKLKGTERLGLQGMLNFKWELAIGKHTLTKAEFDRLVAMNMPIVEINGEWVELRPGDVRAAQAFFENRKANPTLTLEDIMRIASGEGKIIEKLAVVDFEATGVLQELITTLQDNQAVTAIDHPTDFQGQLRPYQGRGVGWLAFLEQWGLGACLADDMGLGKTLQFLGFLLHLKAQKNLQQPVLLICPTSVIGNWERESKKFAPSLRVLLHHGSDRSIDDALAKSVKNYDLVITSYALVYRDLTTLKKIAWRGISLDEAQNIKNAESKQSRAVRELPGKFKVALTGTPVENRLTELWSIMEFLNPGYLGSKQFFQRRFAIPIEKYGDSLSLQTLRGLVQPFILRRLKTDRSIIQDLPEKQEMTVFCNLTPEQAVLYQTTVDQSLSAIDSADGIQRRGMILALLTRLKQICNHPGLVQAPLPPVSELPRASSKLQRLIEMLEVITGQGDRVLIFTQFAEWGKQLLKVLPYALNEEALFLYGSTPRPKREEMIDRFQNDPSAPKILILSLKAGGVGLNLTRANHVFHFDRWWNPAVENQATDRAFRIGQTRNVQVHKFICIGTLEERIHDLIESKRTLAEQVVGAGENWVTELDTDQLRQLLVLDRSSVITE